MGEIAGHPNLKPAKKGEPSRNPAGRPKGAHKLGTLVRRALEKAADPTDPKSGSVYDEWARGLVREVRHAPSGKAAEIILAREWPVTNKLQVGGDPDAPPIRLDYTKLTISELKQLKVLLVKARVDDDDAAGDT